MDAFDTFVLCGILFQITAYDKTEKSDERVIMF